MTDSHDLIKRAERSDHLLRLIHFGIAVMAIALLVFLTVQSIKTNDQLSQQLAIDQQQNERESEHTQEVINEVKRQHETQTEYIRCIAKAFSTTGGRIEDLETCRIESGVTGPFSSAQSPIGTTVPPIPSPRPSTAPAPSKAPPNASPQPTPAPRSVAQEVIKAISDIVKL